MHWLFIEKKNKCFYIWGTGYSGATSMLTVFFFNSIIPVIYGHRNRNLKKRMATILVSSEDSWNCREHLQLSRSYYTTRPMVPPSQSHPGRLRWKTDSAGNWYLHKITVTKSVIQFIRCRDFSRMETESQMGNALQFCFACLIKII